VKVRKKGAGPSAAEEPEGAGGAGDSRAGAAGGLLAPNRVGQEEPAPAGTAAPHPGEWGLRGAAGTRTPGDTRRGGFGDLATVVPAIMVSFACRWAEQGRGSLAEEEERPLRAPQQGRCPEVMEDRRATSSGPPSWCGDKSQNHTESQNGGGWKGPLWVTQSNPPA